MLVLLPPSETKRPGGSGRAWGERLPDTLALPELNSQRERVIDALISLAADEEAAARVLKLSARQRGDIADNAALRSAPTMPAIDRYTGVLFDALDAASLDARARRWLGAHVLIHGAAFGPVGALDPIPTYRLAAGTSVPGLDPLTRLWHEATTHALAARGDRFVLDLRSEAYVGLGTAPAGSLFLRIGTAGSGGVLRALNHFNKRAKGELLRTLALSRPSIRGAGGFLRWAHKQGWLIREEDGDQWLVTSA